MITRADDEGKPEIMLRLEKFDHTADCIPAGGPPSVADGFVIQHFGMRRRGCICFVDLQISGIERQEITLKKALSDGMRQEFCGMNSSQACDNFATIAAIPCKEGH
ncbi:hypothetical protein T11_340 [Trichinella zimbabwensis]|uniref:Uncharacterized protein n=1 Tax=Trichinella zimbabwensis TaxID=268475 RepID=A0A0V1HU67_9BILA|nr:hypothetical protein T11_340 [Trichinella zimbabwensis]